ncbi:MAG: phosphotransferase enzyme family protein [Phycisphaerae bacterium]
MQPHRERFAAGEIQAVLSHYDLGTIESARELPRGSRRAPKLLLRTTHGLYLLKRRAAGRDNPERVAFSHELTNVLRGRGFPVPRLVGTRAENHSLLRLDDRVYEIFEFVDGADYGGSLDQTMSAGATLAAFHRAARDVHTEWKPPETGYHDLPSVRNGLNAIPSTTAGHDSVIGREAELLSLTQQLYECYDAHVAAIEAAGYAGWPRGIVHGDWHPGNLLYEHARVVAVLDLDSARRLPYVCDVANGMLQFSMVRGGDEPANWPDYADEARMRRFWLGYLHVTPRFPIEQRRAIPELMMESLIAESVVPIAATGSFGPIPGFGVLQMVRRKLRWLENARERLLGWLLE